MKRLTEYEVVCTYLNGCAGAAYPQTSFEEVAINSPEDYLREKHGRDFDQFKKEVRPNGQVVFTYENVLTFIYEFNEL